MRHETTNPTPAAPQIFDLAIRPRLDYLSRVVAELIGCAATDPRVARCVISVQAQCLIYRPDPFHAAIAAPNGRSFPGPLEAITEQIATSRSPASAPSGRCVSVLPPRTSHRRREAVDNNRATPASPLRRGHRRRLRQQDDAGLASTRRARPSRNPLSGRCVRRGDESRTWSVHTTAELSVRFTEARVG